MKLLAAYACLVKRYSLLVGWEAAISFPLHVSSGSLDHYVVLSICKLEMNTALYLSDCSCCTLRAPGFWDDSLFGCWLGVTRCDITSHE
jgi:hypothetical protein